VINALVLFNTFLLLFWDNFSHFLSIFFSKINKLRVFTNK
jgi:hypothetical protein